MLQANFTVTPTAGDVLATVFTVTNLTTGAQVKQYVWDFGLNDLIYNTVTPSHTYNYPGTYTISLTAVDFDGNYSYTTQNVTVDLAYRDYISFTQIPNRFSDPGLKTHTPFKISVVSSNPNKPLIVDLFAANSKSTPYQFLPEKWNFLNPSWKFLDKDSNFITSLSVQPIPIYKNNVVVAVSGSAEFYYVDSMSTGDPTENCPILITATLQTSGFNYPLDSNIYSYSSYSNNESVKVGLIWQVNDLFPNLLKVTSNYIDSINHLQWKGIKIPTLVTAHSNRALLVSGSEDITSEPLFTYPGSNNTSQLELFVTGLSTGQYTVDESPLYFQATDNNGFRTGGYVFTTITSQTEITSTSIVAQTTASSLASYDENKFFFPLSYAPNTSVWVSNPQKNTLNKITVIPYPENCTTIEHFKNKNILIDGLIQEISVPALSTTSTFNYTMSGFSGIYSMAIDPRDYSIVAADAELDRLYRISHDGTISNIFELSSLNDYDPHQKAFYHWEYTVTTSQLSSNHYYLYGPYYLSSNPYNYIVMLGGVVQSQESYIINTETRTLQLLTPDPTPILGIKLDVVQIFNPTLPDHYIDSLISWNLSSSTPTTTFNIPTTLSLSSNPGYYFVTVEGLLQSYEYYTVTNSTKTITFDSPVLANAEVQVLYIPSLINPATWSRTYTVPTTSFSLTGNVNYIQSQETDFLVNVGGIFQPKLSYTHDIVNKQLLFTTLLPANISINVTQVAIQDSVDNPAAYTPGSVSLDKNYNIWVSLFNTVSVLKFDPNFNLQFSVAPNTLPYYDFQFDSENLYKPPVVETDKNNNCWTTYAHPLCSMLVQYSPTGSILKQITLPQYSVPVSLAINAQNNVWVANTYNVLSANGNIQLYSGTTGQLLSTVSNIPRPGYLALDRDCNLWFTHSVRGIGHYNVTTNGLYLWNTEAVGEIHIELLSGPNFNPTIQGTPLPSDDGAQSVSPPPDIYSTDEDLGGLAVDVYNRLWILDSYNNNAWVILSATPDLPGERIIKIIPNNTQGYYVNLEDGSTYTESLNYYYKSAQAAGDWTGNKWYQKYANKDSLTVICSGTSNDFEIAEFVNKNQIRRINESFDTAGYYKSLALPENLQSNITLFDSFFAAVVGTGQLSANEDMGQTIYEKIANFTLNHADIDTCNIDQLLSLAEQTAVAASDYSAIYPVEIRNMLDIASVSRAKLWGITDNKPLMPQSIGALYNTQTDYVTAGNYVVLKSKTGNETNIVQVPPLSTNIFVYPVSQFVDYRFTTIGQPMTLNYNIYRFNPVYSEKYIENIIDWNSPYTALQPTLSTLNDWYGEDGVIENIFRYLLTKNLFLK